MSQFRIKGIDYADESLQHGLGKGSGRGRPVGSKNGQVMPGAAYMKDYKIVGQKAEGDTNVPGAQTQGMSSRRANAMSRGTSSGAKSTASRSAPKVAQSVSGARSNRISQNSGVSRTQNTQAPVWTVNNGGRTTYVSPNLLSGSTRQNTGNVASTPSDAVKKGKAAVDRMLIDRDFQPHQLPDRSEKPQEFEPRQLARNATPDRTGGMRSDRPNEAADSRNREPQGFEERQLTDSAAARFQDRQLTDSAAARIQDRNAQNAQQRTPAGNAVKATTNNAVNQHAPASSETPEQKSFWDSVGDWFGQAGKAIGDTAVNAWNTVSDAAAPAAKWVSDRLGDAGDWATTAYQDVSDWVGDRGRDLDAWWNGRDVTVTKPSGATNTTHVNGFADNAGRAISNAANDVGQWVSDTAGNVGNALDTMWNGREREVRKPGENGNVVRETVREGGVRPWLENAGQAIGSAANDVGRTIGDAASNAGQWIGNAANDVGQFVGNTANAAGQAVDRFVNGVPVGSPNSSPIYDLRTHQWVDRTSPSLAERANNAANTAGQWLNDNIVTPMSSAANGVGDFVRNTGNAIGNWWNGTDQNFLGIPTGHTPGARENIGNALNSAGQWINDAAGNVGNAVSNAANDTGRWITDTAGNVGNAVGNAANVAGQAVNNWWNGTDQNFMGIPTGHTPGARENIESALNDAGSAINTWWNGTDQSFLGIPTGHTPGARENIGNALNNAGQVIADTAGNVGNAVANGANAAGQWVGNTASAVGLAGRAIAAGVPASTVEQLGSAYANGIIDADEYTHRMTLAINATRGQ